MSIEGEVHDYIYIIQSGICSLAKYGEIKGFLKTDEVIEMNNILGNEASFFTVTALTNMTLFKFAKVDVMLKIMHLQEGTLFLYNDLKIMVRQMLQWDILHVTDTKNRIKRNIVFLGIRHGEETSDQLILPRIITKKIISDFVRLTPTTVYNICKKLTEEGFLVENGQALIVNKGRAECEIIVVKNLILL
ncbi:Crp/Fnr family transcriptional regulator [Listeria booriae]|nr:Crp/Fnr family transcriptional regulator [Listeria booriae]